MKLNQIAMNNLHLSLVCLYQYEVEFVRLVIQTYDYLLQCRDQELQNFPPLQVLRESHIHLVLNQDSIFYKGCSFHQQLFELEIFLECLEMIRCNSLDHDLPLHPLSVGDVWNVLQKKSIKFHFLHL